jgi:hypothetical protein
MNPSTIKMKRVAYTNIRSRRVVDDDHEIVILGNEYLKKHGISSESVARKAGVSEPGVSNPRFGKPAEFGT